MADRRRMTENELLAIIGRLEGNALGSNTVSGPTVTGKVIPSGQQMTTLEIDRYNALNAYYARPRGDEQEGRSSIILPELRDTIEWIMPQLMRMFVGGKSVVRFEARNANDEDQAELESEVVNYLFMVENNGFFILHDFFKDALLLRNGYVKVYTEKETKSDVESYSGLTQIELTQLIGSNEDEIEVLEQREAVQGEMQPGAPAVNGPTFDVKLRRTRKIVRVKVDCMPPEETLISPKARHGLDDCPFTMHKTTVTRSDLIEMGYDADQVGLITVNRPSWLDLVALARDEVVDQLSDDAEGNDPSTQDVDFRVAELRVDFDGDGVAELRRVILGGEQILDNDEIPEGSFVGCSPVRMPHRHVGISYYDLLNDLQLIKTALFRRGLDNLYQNIDRGYAVDRDKVNVSDLLISRPNRIIRTNGPPGDAILPLMPTPNILEQVIPALNYVDSLREMRTGIGRDTMGLDADALQDVTKGGQLAAMSAAALKVELVARLLAEGVKDIFRKMHAELRKNQDKALTLRIGGKWIDVNPSQWGPRESLTVDVGLGSGTREEARANMLLLAQAQEKAAAVGLVGPQQVYNSFKKALQILGFNDPERYAMDPGSPEYAQWMAQHPPQQNPAIQVAQIKAQIEEMKLKGGQQQKIVELQAQLAQAQQAEATARMKAQVEIAHAQQELQAGQASDRLQSDTQIAETLIRVIGQIVAAQLKQNAQADAGQMVTHDYQEVRQGI